MKILFLLILFSFSAFAQERTSITVLTPGSTITLSGVSTQEYSRQETVESVNLVDGKFEIVKRSISYPFHIPAVYCAPNPCDWIIRRLWKEIYAVKDGKIILESTIEGKIVPASKESYEWPKR